ncbi:hypothetical protein Tco_0324562 [Tanacetum coccineum]
MTQRLTLKLEAWLCRYATLHAIYNLACNKCVNSASHEMCVVNILNSVNATSTVTTVLNKGKQIWKPKGRLSDKSLYKTKRVWKATGKLFADNGYQWRPTGKKFALGELYPLTTLPVTSTTMSANQQDPNTNWGSEVPNPPNSTVFKCRCSGPEPIMMFGQNSSSLVLHQMMSAQISSGLAPQCLKMFDHSSSSLGLHCQKTFKQISSNLVSQMSQRRLLASLQAPFLKEKKNDHLKMEMEMEIPSVKASANSDIIFFFTSAQDGNKLLDDERLSLADDLKKAHDQNQNKSK